MPKFRSKSFPSRGGGLGARSEEGDHQPKAIRPKKPDPLARHVGFGNVPELDREAANESAAPRLRLDKLFRRQNKKPGGDLLSRGPKAPVPSALAGFAAQPLKQFF